MEEPPPLEMPSNAAPMSSASRFANVFVSPGEVFDDIKRSQPAVSNWLVPLILVSLAGIVYVFVVFSQPKVLQAMSEAAQTQIKQQLAAGKITQQQADQRSAMMDKYLPIILKAGGTISAVVSNVIFLFVLALALWLIAKLALRAPIAYLRALEMVGLATMISVLGVVVATLLVVIYGNQAMTPGPVLFLSHFDQHNKVHAALASVNFMTIWYFAALAVGLSRVTGTSFGKAAAWLSGLWVLLTLATFVFMARRQG